MSQEPESILQNRKNFQRNKMLNVIRSNDDISRIDLKNKTSYSMTTVLHSVQELLDDKLIIEESSDDLDRRRGRKPTWLRINPDGGYVIGLEFNRNEMCCVILNFQYDQVYEDSIIISDKKKNATDIVSLIKEMLHKAIDSISSDKRILGIGLGIPGYIDQKNGIAIQYNHIKGWKNIPIREIIRKEFHLPCYMGNNVDVMCYVYKWIVFKGNCEDMLFISIRTGARMIPIIDNKPVIGFRGYKGEIGHIKIHDGSRLCECGRIGCLNSEISDVAIVNKILSGIRIGRFKEIAEMINDDTEKVTMDLFIQSVKNNDHDSIVLLKQCANYLGEVIAELVNIFAPTRIELYGELSTIGEPFLKLVRERIKQDSIKENFELLNLCSSVFRENLGAMGAAVLVIQETFPYVDEKL